MKALTTTVLICLLFASTMLSLENASRGSETGIPMESSRHQGCVTTFAGGVEEKTLTFTSAGTDSSLAVSLPEGAMIGSATLDIEGRAYTCAGDFVVENYTNTANKQAWEDTTNTQFPVTSPPAFFMTTPFTGPDYADVGALDANSKDTMGGASSLGYPTQLYEFDLSQYTVITELEVFWAGSYLDWNSQNTDGMNVSIWNATAAGWETLGGHKMPWGVQPTQDVHVGRTYGANHTDVTDPSSKLLYVIVWGPLGAGFSYCELYTNFISVNISQESGVFYPEDPYLDVGGDGEPDWIHDGELKGKATFSGPEFVEELQGHVDAGTAVEGMVEVPFELGTADTGRLFISNLTITYTTNHAPTFSGEIPGLHFGEDSGWLETGIDLTEMFCDVDDPPSNLTFRLNGCTDLIWGAITEDYQLNLTSAENIYGTVTMNVTCADLGIDGEESGDDCLAPSNDFTVTVLPTDDPPVIISIDGMPVVDHMFTLSAKEETYLNFTVLAEDIDGDDIVYSEDVDDEALEIEGNTVSFFPGQEDVGFFNFTLFATEVNESRLKDQVDIIIEVANANDGPLMEEIPDMAVDEDSWLNFTVGADDVDLACDPEEKLEYGTDFGDTGIDKEHWDLDALTGQFSFLPDNSMVGEYAVRFTVKDNSGESDGRETTIEVRNVNDPPLPGPISHSVVDAHEGTEEPENLTVSFSTEPADDPDLIHGDTLTYTWDFDASDGLDFQASGTTAQWTYGTPGNYTVTLTATDSGTPRLSGSVTLDIRVLAPPAEKSEGEVEDGESDEDNVTDGQDDVEPTGEVVRDPEAGDPGLAMLAVAVAAIVVVALIVALFFAVRRKEGGKEGEGGTGGEHPAGGKEDGVVSPGPKTGHAETMGEGGGDTVGKGGDAG